MVSEWSILRCIHWTRMEDAEADDVIIIIIIVVVIVVVIVSVSYTHLTLPTNREV